MRSPAADQEARGLMATCKFCGKWSGLFDDQHLDCALAAAQGKTLESFTEIAPPRPLTAVTIFWTVFGALWAFGLTAGIVAAILRELLR
jgi:hypothetical protein